MISSNHEPPPPHKPREAQEKWNGITERSVETSWGRRNFSSLQIITISQSLSRVEEALSVSSTFKLAWIGGGGGGTTLRSLHNVRVCSKSSLAAPKLMCVVPQLPVPFNNVPEMRNVYETLLYIKNWHFRIIEEEQKVFLFRLLTAK